MKNQEKEQIRIIIKNLKQKLGYIPYLSNLENHETFGPIIITLHPEDKEEIKEIIEQDIQDTINNTKTKGWELFKRFFEVNEIDFRKFRKMNDPKEDHSNNKEFQKLWNKIEEELFKYEWILTEKMLKQEKWLDKVIEAFYNIVYTFFPRLNEIE